MKSKKAKLYVYVCNDRSDSVFKAYTKEDIRKHLGVTNYKIATDCWEESSLNINTYFNEIDIIDLTN